MDLPEYESEGQDAVLFVSASSVPSPVLSMQQEAQDILVEL